MSKMTENRPCLCFDKTCKILYNVYDEEYHNKGYSYFCFGKLKEPHVFMEKECKHINEYCYCVYTPLKGVLRFYINENDAWIYQLGMCAIMSDSSPLVCDECGNISRIGNTVICFDGGVELCPLCAFRLGRTKWNSENKIYVYKGE